MDFKEQYLARCKKWVWYDESTISVFLEGDKPTQLTKWQTLVFHAADGNTSLQELIEQLNKGISNKANEDFTQELDKSVKELKALKAIEYWDKKNDLVPDYEEELN